MKDIDFDKLLLYYHVSLFKKIYFCGRYSSFTRMLTVYKVNPTQVIFLRNFEQAGFLRTTQLLLDVGYMTLTDIDILTDLISYWTAKGELYRQGSQPTDGEYLATYTYHETPIYIYYPASMIRQLFPVIFRNNLTV